MQADNFQRIEETLLSTRILIADHHMAVTPVTQCRLTLRIPALTFGGCCPTIAPSELLDGT